MRRTKKDDAGMNNEEGARSAGLSADVTSAGVSRIDGPGIELGGFAGAELPQQLCWQVFAGQRCENPIRNTRRQLVRPLVDCLIRDPDALCGGGDGTAEQFDGLDFQHVGLY